MRKFIFMLNWILTPYGPSPLNENTHPTLKSRALTLLILAQQGSVKTHLPAFNLLSPTTALWGRKTLVSPFSDEDIEMQERGGTCLRSQTWQEETQASSPDLRRKWQLSLSPSPLHGLARHTAAGDLGSSCIRQLALPLQGTEGSQVQPWTCCEGKASPFNPFCTAGHRVEQRTWPALPSGCVALG